MTRFTVLGAGGFIGGALTDYLRIRGHDVRAVTREGLDDLLVGRAPAGHVVCCIGLTADFRTRPLATAEAHAGLVARLLERIELDSFLYLSSTRLYARCDTAREDTPIPVLTTAPADLYAATKLAGEALVLSDPRPRLRAVRLANVYGPGMGVGTFLGQLLAEGRASGRLHLRQNLRSAKDYVALADVLPRLEAIALRGGARLYNLASGANTSHDAIVQTLARACGWSIAVPEDAPPLRFPRIDIARLAAEFGAPACSILEDLPALARPRQEVAC
jgi:nucleoside-diphosphate-sugar epimerase